jgi:hypothetical protein
VVPIHVSQPQRCHDLKTFRGNIHGTYLSWGQLQLNIQENLMASVGISPGNPSPPWATQGEKGLPGRNVSQGSISGAEIRVDNNAPVILGPPWMLPLFCFFCHKVLELESQADPQGPSEVRLLTKGHQAGTCPAKTNTQLCPQKLENTVTLEYKPLRPLRSILYPVSPREVSLDSGPTPSSNPGVWPGQIPNLSFPIYYKELLTAPTLLRILRMKLS